MLKIYVYWHKCSRFVMRACMRTKVFQEVLADLKTGLFGGPTHQGCSPCPAPPRPVKLTNPAHMEQEGELRFTKNTVGGVKCFGPVLMNEFTPKE